MNSNSGYNRSTPAVNILPQQLNANAQHNNNNAASSNNWGYTRQQMTSNVQSNAEQQLLPHHLTNNTASHLTATQQNILKDPRGTSSAQQIHTAPAAATSSAVVDYGTDGQRRPHTAHGPRAGFPATIQQQSATNSNAVNYVDPQAKNNFSNSNAYVEDDEAHVVAGARGMMRYRRNNSRTNTNEQQQQSQQASSSQLFNNNNSNNKNWTHDGQGSAAMAAQNNTTSASPWALYQNQQQQQQQGNGSNSNANMAAKISAQQQQHPALRKSGTASSQGTASNWPQQGFSNDRPKSAGISSTASGAPTGGGLIASLTGAGRPSSSTPVMTSNNNWNTNNNNNNAAVNNAAALNTSANTNTLSYGSLKNRFLSGATKNNASSSGNNNGVGVIGSNTNNVAPVSSTSTKSSKLFTLSRS